MSNVWENTMEVVRHCAERLPLGERHWRRAARLAGFNGRLNVVGLGHYRWSAAELTDPRRKVMGVTRGYYSSSRKTITIFVPHSPCAQKDSKKWDVFMTFLHELGHARLDAKGENDGAPPWASMKAWKANRAEQVCDRYARYLKRRLEN